MAQFGKRAEHLEKARGTSLEEIERVTRTAIEQKTPSRRKQGAYVQSAFP